MDGVLVVVRPFGRYATGEVIDDPRQQAPILAGENARNVVRVAAATHILPHRGEA
jgi:hypothetical protein